MSRIRIDVDAGSFLGEVEVTREPLLAHADPRVELDAVLDELDVAVAQVKAALRAKLPTVPPAPHPAL